jgi:molecular chaperone DnaJ
MPEMQGQRSDAGDQTRVSQDPAGVDNGSRLRLSGEGEPGVYGGPPGDLYVFIHAQNHEFFERRDNDIICQAGISFVQAALGDKITVPTLDGSKILEIPKGTQPGDVLYFHGEGIPSLRTRKRGDQIIQIMIKTPTNLSKKQEELCANSPSWKRQVFQQAEGHAQGARLTSG